MSSVWITLSQTIQTGRYNFYVYEEQLSGFPESKVYWASCTGPCLGIALRSPCADSTLDDTNQCQLDGLETKNPPNSGF